VNPIKPLLRPSYQVRERIFAAGGGPRPSGALRRDKRKKRAQETWRGPWRNW